MNLPTVSLRFIQVYEIIVVPGCNFVSFIKVRFNIVSKSNVDDPFHLRHTPLQFKLTGQSSSNFHVRYFYQIKFLSKIIPYFKQSNFICCTSDQTTQHHRMQCDVSQCDFHFYHRFYVHLEFKSELDLLRNSHWLFRRDAYKVVVRFFVASDH